MLQIPNPYSISGIGYLLPCLGVIASILRSLLLSFAFPLSDQLDFLFLDSIRSPAFNYSVI